MHSRRPPPRPGFVSFDRAALDESIPARFERQAGAHPERLAVRFEGGSWTYGELEQCANRIARAVLRTLGPQSAPVALLVGQGLGLVAAILGVLKAGAFYVPLEVWYSPEVAASIVDEVGAGLVLADEAGAALARTAAPAAPVLRVDQILAADHYDDAPGIVVGADSPAYVYYTSGSTGRPVGVLDSHRNVLHNVMRYTNSLGIDREDRLTLLQSPSFSGAVSSMFGALLNGAALLPYDLRRRGAAGLERWLVGERITIYHSVPAVFRLAMAGTAGLPDLRLVRLEGDQMSRYDWIAFRDRCPEGCVLVNGLGATECGLVRQFFIDRATPVAEGVVPIGYPVEDMEIEVVDPAGRAVAAGEAGEIVVRSRYIAIGYLGRPDLTQRLVGHADAPGDRTYRTGDLGRLDPDGCLTHLGRLDARTKIRGQWVDLAEVEAALAGAPEVREAAARTHAGRTEEPRLVGYVVPLGAKAPGAGELRAHLAGRLPPAAIPTTFVSLPRLPLNPNGKVNRAALPPPPAPDPDRDTESIASPTALESAIAEVWAEVLQLQPVGVHDSFFDLGGDSLGMSQVQIRLERLLGVELSIGELYEHLTIHALARHLEPRGSRVNRRFPRDSL